MEANHGLLRDAPCLNISIYGFSLRSCSKKGWSKIMTKRTTRKVHCSRILWLLAALVMAIVLPTALCQENSTFVSGAGQMPGAQTLALPQWQAAAGGRKEFDVASVRQNKSSEKPRSNIPLTAGETYSPTGGVFSATNQSLFTYILFAYKVRLNEAWDQWKRLPQWARTDSFDIQAKTEDHKPTKDQSRLMMQSLLEDRFKLVVHWKIREVPIFALVLAKPGKTGSQLKPHLADSLCSTATPVESSHKPSAASAPVTTLLGVWPEECGNGDDMWATHRGRYETRFRK